MVPTLRQQFQTGCFERINVVSRLSVRDVSSVQQNCGHDGVRFFSYVISGITCYPSSSLLLGVFSTAFVPISNNLPLLSRHQRCLKEACETRPHPQRKRSPARALYPRTNDMTTSATVSSNSNSALAGGRHQAPRSTQEFSAVVSPFVARANPFASVDTWKTQSKFRSNDSGRPRATVFCETDRKTFPINDALWFIFAGQCMQASFRMSENQNYKIAAANRNFKLILDVLHLVPGGFRKGS